MAKTLDNIKNEMIGKTFGRLTVKKYLGRSERGDNMWKCVCTCGSEVVGRTSLVSHDKAGCKICKRASGAKAEKQRTYLLNKTFGRLTVLEYDGSTKYYAGKWKCQCTCGNIVSVRSAHLLQGTTKSCGCYAREAAARSGAVHGLHTHPLYAVWSQMKDRCFNPNNKFYQRYGGREITVCEDWRYDFLTFYRWAIHNGYKEGLTIDRIDNDDNYEPGNCRWATQEIQMQNTSLTKINPKKVVKIRMDPRINSVIAKAYGVDESTVSRIKNGKTWSNIL